MSFIRRHARKIAVIGPVVFLLALLACAGMGLRIVQSSREVVFVVKRAEVDNQGILRFNYGIENWISSGVLRVIQRFGDQEEVDEKRIEADVFRRRTRSSGTGINVDDPKAIMFKVRSGDIIRLEKGQQVTVAEGQRTGVNLNPEKYEMTLRFD